MSDVFFPTFYEIFKQYHEKECSDVNIKLTPFIVYSNLLSKVTQDNISDVTRFVQELSWYKGCCQHFYADDKLEEKFQKLSSVDPKRLRIVEDTILVSFENIEEGEMAIGNGRIIQSCLVGKDNVQYLDELGFRINREDDLKDIKSFRITVYTEDSEFRISKEIEKYTDILIKEESRTRKYATGWTHPVFIFDDIPLEESIGRSVSRTIDDEEEKSKREWGENLQKAMINCSKIASTFMLDIENP